MKSFIILLFCILSTVSNASLVAQYEFESDLTDSVGSYDGVAHGTVEYGQSTNAGGSSCLKLTAFGTVGGSDGVVIPGSESLLDSDQSLTIALWFKSEANNPFGYNDAFVSKLAPSTTKWDGQGWSAKFSQSSGHQICFLYSNGVLPAQYPVTNGWIVNDTKWHHLVFSYASITESPDGNCIGRVYVDGVKASETISDLGWNILSSSSVPITIGVAINASGTEWVYRDGAYGYIDDVRLYNDFIDDASVANLYLATLGAPVITEQPNFALVDINDTAVFTVSGVGINNYSWYRSSDPNNDTSGDDISVGTDSNTLTLTDVQSTDEGYYYCVLTGSNGNTYSEPALLMTKRAVSQWQFENNLNDFIDGYNGVSTNTPVYTTGMIGANALVFSNDVNDVVAVTHEPKLNTSSFTISAWAKPVVDSNDISRVVACSRNTNAGYVLYARSAGKWAFTVSGSDGGQRLDGLSINFNEWTLVTATFEQTDVLGDDLVGTSSIYVNGKFVGSLSNVKYQPDVSSADFYVGSDWSSASGNFNPFYGSVDDVRYYSYALDSRQVAQLYADGTGQPVCVPEYAHDHNEDCKVDFKDFAEFAAEWLNDSFVYPVGL